MRLVRSPFVELLASFGRAAAEHDLGWYLFGAQAALLYGANRLTADVDVTVHLGSHPTNTLADALERHGFRLRVEDDTFVQQTRVLPVLHEPTGITADVVLAGPGLEELFLRRARDRDLDGVEVPVACAEDVVAMKILAGRPRDLDDAVSILAAQGTDIDLDGIRETLRTLEEGLGQSDLLPALERALELSRMG